MNSDEIIRITLEVTLGTEPPEPDNEEQAEFRRQVTLDIAEIKAAGLIVEIPYDD